MKINLDTIVKLFNNVFFNNYFLVFVLTLLFLGLIILLIKLVNKVLNNIIKFNQDIKKEIQTVQTKFIQLSPEVDLLIQLSIDNWRLAKKIKEVQKKLSNKEKQSINFSIERIEKQLSKFDIEIKDYTNERYYEGLNIDVISTEKNKSVKDAIIKDTVEPAVIIKGQLVKKAKVILLTN